MENPAGRSAADDRPIAVVLAGAGARGAYQAGALSVILPALGAEQPRFYLGASVGAINAVACTSVSHLDPDDGTAKMLGMWRSVRRDDVFTWSLGAAVGQALRRRGDGRPRSLLDSAPLNTTLERLFDWRQFHANIAEERVWGCGVVGTANSTHSSTIFLESRSSRRAPEDDALRGVEFRPAKIAPVHVVASSAIPAIFPAVRLADDRGADWYVDGGVRLNTPIKPALTLGARRVVVVATDPTRPAPPAGPDRPPGVGAGIVDLLRAVLVDPMVEDLRTLVSENRKAAKSGEPRTVEYLFAGPQRSDDLIDVARSVLRSRRWYSPARRVAGSAELSRLGSYLLFDPEFIEGALELGARDASRHVGADGRILWRTEQSPDDDPPGAAGTHHQSERSRDRMEADARYTSPRLAKIASPGSGAMPGGSV
ncbi:MAG TPA: patatin-like phospholipase family protein [Acidimicrobiales bacterium]|nr:patatin-like phospholipase family protein [Acidimicrobiales bacterium]